MVSIDGSRSTRASPSAARSSTRTRRGLRRRPRRLGHHLDAVRRRRVRLHELAQSRISPRVTRATGASPACRLAARRGGGRARRSGEDRYRVDRARRAARDARDARARSSDDLLRGTPRPHRASTRGVARTAWLQVLLGDRAGPRSTRHDRRRPDVPFSELRLLDRRARITMQAPVPRAPVYLRGLDGLRAIAACGVMVSHALKELGRFAGHSPRHSLELGRQGVAMFFALSGFQITYLLLEERERAGGIDLGAFYVRRILRIWPLYFVALGIAMAYHGHATGLLLFLFFM